MSGVNGRQPSEAPSSSSSDLYAANDAVAAPANVSIEAPKLAQAQPVADYEDDDGDASSEMDVSDSSSSTASGHPDSAPSHAGAKRKLSDADMDSTTTTTSAQDSVKKPRVSLPPIAVGVAAPSVAGWPPELWQHVFVHLSPAMLSRCLRVCKSFNFYLTQLKATNLPIKRNAPAFRVIDSEVVWVQSRKHAYNTMPRPLAGFSELRMLQLIGGQSCESCGKAHVKTPTPNAFNAGPGESGVRIIWPFRLRLCGNCFLKDSLTVRTDLPILSVDVQAYSGFRTSRCSQPSIQPRHWHEASLTRFEHQTLTSYPTTSAKASMQSPLLVCKRHAINEMWIVSLQSSTK